jgi:hypothetical protein
MSGWRDAEGRTASERRRLRAGEERARFVDTARRRPLTLLKSLAGFAFILLLVFFVIGWLR